MTTIRMVVADDHPIFLDGLCQLIKSRHPEIEIVGSAEDGRQALDRTRELRPDVLLLDIRMPKMSGIEVAEILKQELPELKIVMLTTFNEQPLLEGAMKAKADGFMLKESSVDDVAEAIHLVMRGNILLPSKTARGTDPVVLLRTGGDPAATAPDPDATTSFDPDARIPATVYGESDESRNEDRRVLDELTEREREVFQLIVRNYGNKMIARELLISERTVRNYVSKIYEITGKHNRSSLIIWAMKRGLIR